MQRDLEGVGPHGVDRADEAAPDDVLDLDDGAIAGQRPQRVADPELSEDPLTILTRPAEPLDLDDRIGRDERRAARTVLPAPASSRSPTMSRPRSSTRWIGPSWRRSRSPSVIRARSARMRSTTSASRCAIDSSRS